MQQREEKDEDEDDSCHGRRVRRGECLHCNGKEDKGRSDEGATRGLSGGADKECKR